MNKVLPISSAASKIWRGKVPGLLEFGALINNLPAASLLFDRTHDTVLLVNSALLKLAAFTQTEVCGGSIGGLLINCSLDQFAPGSEWSGMLRRRDRDVLPVIVQVSALDTAGQWLLVTLSQKEKFEKEVRLQEDRIYLELTELTRQAGIADLDSYLTKAAEVVKDLFETNLVCIYQAKSEYPTLQKIATFETTPVFPEILPSSDLIRLSNPVLWFPGKRVSTELHRAGRVANLTYLASTPLGQTGALFGMLVIGGSETQPIDRFIKIVELTGSLMTNALQHYYLQENLQRQVDQQIRQITIQDHLLDNTREGIFLLDPNLRVVRMNPPAELMLGYTEWEVYGQPVENVLIGPDELVSALEAACRGIPMHDIGNVTLHRRNGQSFPVQIQTIPVHKDGELLGVLVSAMDVSENEQIRVRTQQLEHRAVLGELTAIFAHEVRNPINNVSTGLQLMASRLMETDPNQELINRMQGDCARLNHLMESVLSFSRPIEHKFETVDLAVLLQRILDRWRPRFAKVNVKPFFQADEKTPPVTGDPRTLEQVFTNLFSNAVEAMSKTGGILAVKITPNDTIANRPQVEVSVSDNGPGIPDEIRDRIFEPFVTTNSKGTGLGLAITKRIVTEHQGNISVNSFPGGTVFHVFLPAFNGD